MSIKLTVKNVLDKISEREAPMLGNSNSVILRRIDSLVRKYQSRSTDELKVVITEANSDINRLKQTRWADIYPRFKIIVAEHVISFR